VFRSRARVLGLLVLVTSLAACTSAEAVTPVRSAADRAAVPSYEPPAGAPAFCAELAGSGRLLEVPRALGTLAARPGDVEAELQVSAAVRELRSVLDTLRASDGPARLDAAVETLADDLAAAVSGPLTAVGIAGISAGLADVDTLAQPVCGFPS
jgi:hypothetical protein